MTKYQLAKLIAMAEGLKSRKRIQKTVHLLQVAGCPIDADYRLHYYGPYSSDVAELLDEMTANGLLEEKAEELTPGKQQYNYSLPENVRHSMEEFEQSERGDGATKEMTAFAPLLRDLCGQPAKTLEYASTIAYFVKVGRDWESAVEETAKYKNVTPASASLIHARELAERVVQQGDGND